MGIVIGATLLRATSAQCVAGIRGVAALNDVTAATCKRATASGPGPRASTRSAPSGPSGRGAAARRDHGGDARERRGEAARPHRDLVFAIPDLLSYISHVMTLEPGDVVATGTPAGVGPLHAGDVVEVELVGYSTVSNPVEAEA